MHGEEIPESPSTEATIEKMSEMEEMQARYVEQQIRMSCPACGEELKVF